MSKLSLGDCHLPPTTAEGSRAGSRESSSIFKKKKYYSTTAGFGNNFPTTTEEEGGSTTINIVTNTGSFKPPPPPQVPVKKAYELGKKGSSSPRDQDNSSMYEKISLINIENEEKRHTISTIQTENKDVTPCITHDAAIVEVR